MLARVDAAEIAEMQALYELEPWGEERADLRSAYGCVASRTAAGDTSAELSDWMPSFEQESPEDKAKRMRDALLSAADGKIVRK